MMVVASIAALVLAVLAAAAAWRFSMVRNSGARAMMRELPAEGVHGWRHGVMRYDGERLLFFKLRSLTFHHDIELDRRGVEFEGFRDVTEEEREFMPEIGHVLRFSGPTGEFEFAADKHTEMGLVSWVEAAPDARKERIDVHSLAQRAQRDTAQRDSGQG